MPLEAAAAARPRRKAPHRAGPCAVREGEKALRVAPLLKAAPLPRRGHLAQPASGPALCTSLGPKYSNMVKPAPQPKSTKVV